VAALAGRAPVKPNTGTRHRLFGQMRFLFIASRDMRWAVASQAVISGTNFLTTVILVRGLGLEAFGVFSICFLLAMMVHNFLGSFLLTPLATIGPRLRVSSLPAYRGFLLANALAFAATTSLALAALVLVVSGSITLAVATAAVSATGTIAELLRRQQFALGSPARAFVVDAIRYGVQAASLLALLLIAHEALAPAAALLVLATGAAAGSLAGLRGFGNPRRHRRFWSAVWSRHWDVAKWTTPSVALDAIQTSGILLIGAALLGPAALGAVRAMQSFANVTNVVSLALQSALPSMAARVNATAGRSAMFRMLAGVALPAVAALLAVAATVLATAGYTLPTWFGVDAAPAILILGAYLTLNILAPVRLAVSTALLVGNAAKRVFTSTLAGTVIAVLGTVLLGPAYGGVAIPVSLILGAATSAAIQALTLYKRRSAR
jgi:O-antigen/teichoic acid export membrane protein